MGKIQNAGPSPRIVRFPPSAALHHFFMSLCFGLFPEIALGDGLKNDICFCSARHFSSHIGICHLNKHHKIAPEAMFLDFSENGDSPENSRIRVKSLTPRSSTVIE